MISWAVFSLLHEAWERHCHRAASGSCLSFPMTPSWCSGTVPRFVPAFLVTASKLVLKQVLASDGSCSFCPVTSLSAVAVDDAAVVLLTELTSFTHFVSSVTAWLSVPLAVSVSFSTSGTSSLLLSVLLVPVTLRSSSPLEFLWDFAEHRRPVITDLAESRASQSALNFISRSLFLITALYMLSSPSGSCSK